MPTLDFELWLEKDGEINHSYFQKPMKTPYVVMKRSAISQHQKMSILSNEVVRRLSNINHKRAPKEEIVKHMEVFITEMVTSGYGRGETREIVAAGMLGWQRKMKRREEEGRIYRSARSTLPMRCRKKLLEKTSWYKQKRKREEDEEDEIGEKKRRKKLGGATEKKKNVQSSGKVKAVMFTPYTHQSELAKELRQAETKLEELTGYKLKVVERAGMRLEDLIRKSDPWEGIDCYREACLLCKTKEKTDKNRSQECTKRSLVYEIWCMDCEKMEEERIKGEAGENKELEKELLKRKKLYKYIGETSRSIYERAYEHSMGVDSLHSGSYMLKHNIDMHEGEELDTTRFGVKVLKFTRTSFERQILESVKLQENTNHFLLNSKSEYNRCAIPRLTTKIGEKIFDRLKSEEIAEKIKEGVLEEKIRNLRKLRNRERRRAEDKGRESRGEKEDHHPPTKKRKKNELEKWMVVETPQKTSENIPEGWKDEEKKEEENAITVGERISCISGTIVDAEKEKEEQAPENTLGESVPQELELWVMVEPQNKNKT